MQGYKSVMGITCVPLGLTNINVWALAQHDKAVTTFVTEETRKYMRENIAEGVDNQMVLQETALPPQKFIGLEQSFDENRTPQIALSNICTCFGLFDVQLPQNARKPGCFGQRYNQDTLPTRLIYFTWTFLKHVLTLICRCDTSHKLQNTIPT